MEKVVTIKLSGHDAAFDMDDNVYQLLHRYLEESRSRLDNDPDHEEVIRDLEQSIGDRLTDLHQRDRHPLNLETMQTMLDEMGAVEIDTIPPVPPSTMPPKRKPLYRISEGKWFAGVCVGLAAYGDYDVAWLRTAFILLGLFTGGVFILAYVVLALVLPVVSTQSEYATLLDHHVGRSPRSARE